MRTRVSADDLFQGLVAGLVVKGWQEICMRDGYADLAFEAAYKKLLQLADTYDLDVMFRVRRHPIHGDSTVLRDSIFSAAQDGMVSLENPEYQEVLFKQKPEEAERLLESLPGGKELFTTLCGEFEKYYDAAAA